MTPGDLVQAVRAAVSQHDPPAGDWQVDDFSICCYAGEFWDVVLRAVCEQAGAMREARPESLDDEQLDKLIRDLDERLDAAVRENNRRAAGKLLEGGESPRVPRDVTLLSWGLDPGYAPPWPGAGVQPGQVLPGHPDVAHPAAWGEHPRDCDCGDCP